MTKIAGFLGMETEAQADISENGQFATITFQKSQEVLASDPLFVATRAISFTIQMSENASEFPIRLVIGGEVLMFPGTRALLIAHMGNATTFTTFEPMGEDATRKLQHEIQATIPAGVDVHVTLFLLAERDTGSDVQIMVEFLNVSLEREKA